MGNLPFYVSIDHELYIYYFKNHQFCSDRRKKLYVPIIDIFRDQIRQKGKFMIIYHVSNFE